MKPQTADADERSHRTVRPLFFTNLQILDGMTLGIFTISASWKVVTLDHGNFRKPAMSEFPVFDAKTLVLKQVTLCQSLDNSEKQGIFRLREPKYNVTLEDKNRSVKKLNGMNPEFRQFAKRR